LPFAGEVIKEIVAKASSKEPVAVLVLNACRFDRSCRLAEELNKGEPTRRAEVSTARAPIPSITALGMPFCLPGLADRLRVEPPAKSGTYWRVTAEGVPGDLTQAGQRREWLKQPCTILGRAAP
jgi:PglZ domain